MPSTKCVHVINNPVKLLWEVQNLQRYISTVPNGMAQVISRFA